MSLQEKNKYALAIDRLRAFFLGICFFYSSVPLAVAMASEQVVQIALSSAPTQLNPFFSTDANSQNLGRLTHISLIDADSEMIMVCRLCKSFTQRMEGAKHHLRFMLREDVKFWDGTPLTAQDVENSVKYFTTEDPQIQSIFRAAFSAIKKVIVHGKYDVELIYDKFDLENLTNLPLLKIIRIAESAKSKKTVELSDIIGAGIYKYDEIQELFIRLVPAFEHTRPTYVFKVVKDETTLTLKLIKKEIDLSVVDISPRKQYWIKNQKENNLVFWDKPGTNLNYIGINHKREIFKDVRVRQALSLLIPREDLLKYKLKNTATLASSLISPAFKGRSFYSSFDAFDPVLARKLLDDAGYKLNGDKVRISLNWRVSNNKATVEMAETIANFFRKEGVLVNLIIQEWGTFQRGFKNGEYDLVSASWVGLAGPEMLKAVFHSDNFSPRGLNRGYFSSSEFNQLIDSATVQTDELARNKLYIKAQEFIKGLVPYLYLWHPNVIWIGQKCLVLKNLYPNGSFYPLLELQSYCSSLKK